MSFKSDHLLNFIYRRPNPEIRNTAAQFAIDPGLNLIYPERRQCSIPMHLHISRGEAKQPGKFLPLLHHSGYTESMPQQNLGKRKITLCQQLADTG